MKAKAKRIIINTILFEPRWGVQVVLVESAF